MTPLPGLYCPVALLPGGWADAVVLRFDAEGFVTSVTRGAAPGDLPQAAGPVIPGLPNVHSHAFQRAMAGLTQHAGPGDDDFWTWRRAMYGFVEHLTPEAVEAVAAYLYVEMLRHGFTAVGEFHYLHHQPDGTPYADRAELAHRIRAAARRAGIGLTLLPVLYACGDFGGAAPAPGQRRFLNDVEGLARIAEASAAAAAADPQVRVGVAPHSLRAITPAHLRDLLAWRDAFDPAAPLHLHVAEQTREVDACLAWSGARPVAWLLDHAPVSASWCLVHATHMDEAETSALAATGAVAGLCPTTEADLGDGLFPAQAFLAAGGRFGVGSDSHTRVSAPEELRLLEYGQRLARMRRNVLRAGDTASVGAGLYRAALAGGAQALGRPIGHLAPGARADAVVLDGRHPLLAGKSGDALLDTYVFSAGPDLIHDVIAGGRHVVQAGHHPMAEQAAEAFARTMRELAARS